MKRLLRRQAVECLACGTRLPGYVQVGRSKRWMRATSKGQSFMRPRDGRSSDQLLQDLKRAEHDREIGEALDSRLSMRHRQRR
jgi:hypothetical protein